MSIQDPGIPLAVETQEPSLVGRSIECSRLDDLLQCVRGGGSAVLAVRGEAGIGKTALLDYTARRAEDFHVVRVSGVEREAALPYAGLHLLCARLSDNFDRLRIPHREALKAATGAPERTQLDPFAVCVATLTLFGEAAAAQPLLCIVDDLQWLDRPTADVLSFVFRRLGGHRVAFLVASSEPYCPSRPDRVPELALGGLSDPDARALLRSVVPGRVDSAVVERIIAETRGNPRALLDLLRDVSPDEFAGGFGAGTYAGQRRDERDEAVLEHLARLPTASRRQLLAAAADPIGDPILHWRAIAGLGIPYEALEPLVSDGLLSIGTRVTFGHPSMRSRVYRLASGAERREVHRALAAATDPASDPDRRAWHLAHAAERPDDELADELERCAPRASDRAGVAASAAFLEWAALLTSDPGRRTERLLSAAAAKREMGAHEAATRLLVTAELGSLNRLQRGRLERLRAEMVFTSTRGCGAVGPLLDVARTLDPLVPDLSRETYLDAFAAAMFAGRFDSGARIAKVARAACNGTSPWGPRRAIDCLLDGVVCRLLNGYGRTANPLAGALTALVSAGAGDETAPWLCLASQAAADLWDDETWDKLTARRVTAARDSGALTAIRDALICRALAEVHFGDLATAAALIDEAERASGAHGSPFRHAALVLAAWRGDEDRAQQLFERVRRDAYDRRAGLLLTTVDLSAAVLYNGVGRFGEAFEAARAASELDELAVSGWALTELVEAAARSGKPEAAALALERLSERTRVSGTEWALGVEARSRALLSRDSSAEALYVEGIERLERSRIVVHAGRAHLAYGEWLRRQGRRVDARVQLGAAYDLLSAIGANAFADRAKRELLATGERARRRTDDTRNQLTPQEARIASLAIDGLTNPEIATRLFVSPRTVEYHLHKVFIKLGIRSRAELHLMPRPGCTTTPAATRQGKQDESGGGVIWASSVRDQARTRVPNASPAMSG